MGGEYSLAIFVLNECISLLRHDVKPGRPTLDLTYTVAVAGSAVATFCATKQSLGLKFITSSYGGTGGAGLSIHGASLKGTGHVAVSGMKM